MDYKNMTHEQLKTIENELLTKMEIISKERKIQAEENWQLCDKPGVIYNRETDRDMESKMWEKETKHVALHHEWSLVSIYLSKFTKLLTSRAEAKVEVDKKDS